MALTNSWGLSLEALRAMYRPLEEKLTLVYFDPRGMGGSGPVREESDRGLAAVRADFQALRAHLKLQKVQRDRLVERSHQPHLAGPRAPGDALVGHLRPRPGEPRAGGREGHAGAAPGADEELRRPHGRGVEAGALRGRADRPAAEDVARGLLPDPLRRPGEGQGARRRGVPRRPAELAARRLHEQGAADLRRARPAGRHSRAEPRHRRGARHAAALAGEGAGRRAPERGVRGLREERPLLARSRSRRASRRPSTPSSASAAAPAAR